MQKKKESFSKPKNLYIQVIYFFLKHKLKHNTYFPVINIKRPENPIFSKNKFGNCTGWGKKRHFLVSGHFKLKLLFLWILFLKYLYYNSRTRQLLAVRSAVRNRLMEDDTNIFTLLYSTYFASLLCIGFKYIPHVTDP